MSERNEGGAGREILQILVFAMATIGAIAAVVVAGFVLWILFVTGLAGGQWG